MKATGTTWGVPSAPTVAIRASWRPPARYVRSASLKALIALSRLPPRDRLRCFAVICGILRRVTFQPDRHSEILAALAASGRVVSADVAAQLGVSIDTVRRDLAELEALGVL